MGDVLLSGVPSPLSNQECLPDMRCNLRSQFSSVCLQYLQATFAEGICCQTDEVRLLHPHHQHSQQQQLQKVHLSPEDAPCRDISNILPNLEIKIWNEFNSKIAFKFCFLLSDLKRSH